MDSQLDNTSSSDLWTTDELPRQVRLLNEVAPLISTSTTGPPSIAKSSREPLLKLLPISKPRPKHRPEDDISVHSSSQAESIIPEDSILKQTTNLFPQAEDSKTRLTDLPLEIQDGIIGFIHGGLRSTASDGPRVGSGAKNWNRVMRHPRRKQLSDLALISRAWRSLVQQRIYRHIKIKGTIAELNKCGDWFLTCSHLQPYVRHFEVWVPVWEMKDPRHEGHARLDVPSERLQLRGNQFIWVHDTLGRPEGSSTIMSYRHASQNATLEEILGCAKALFPEACALTIEGGHCKKPRRILHSREARLAVPTSFVNPHTLSSHVRGTSSVLELPIHTNIHTLVLKGAWNIIRQDSDFHSLSLALPNLREWHCNYSKPKTEAYQAICAVLKHFPSTIVHLNISFEGLYSKEPYAFEKWRNFYQTHHICLDLGRLCPQLETLAYTGRICHCLFQTPQRAGTDFRGRYRLKSVDLNVRNCCRDNPNTMNNGTGIHNWNFIQCFEKLVENAVAALQVYKQLSFLRIRFIDLDSPTPLLNPYFQLYNLDCSGIWNNEILSLLSLARPGAHFEDHDLARELMVEVREDLGEGRALKTRPKSIKVSSYLPYADIMWM